ncbi:hypothetical protein [Streptomyces sp. TLI_185]|uniref:hypothetical protein n=1 Tax=Streptomyces sp. TLI_185 TaxID=2485151 RepID=UPI000F50109D|nr:hypothetical protein [Streptomyces sp. TLI_185]RPF39364.1 hypothetical protein EDD92_9615 [Streptomyces sp. TLI_185]
MGLADSFGATVLVERHLLALIDTDPEIEEPFSRLPRNGSFLVHEGSVVVASALEDQMARVRVELWDSMPDAPPGDAYQSMGEPAPVTFDSEQIQLINLMREPSGDEYELADAGPYQVRVWVGPQEEDPEEELEAYRLFERFVIQLWR